jgi:hypothetical protein
MFQLLLRAALATLLISAPLAAQQPAAMITPAAMMRHIERLASDEFQGRAPGTEGERLTINYIAEQFAARGLEPGGEGGSWFQPVRLVERRPGASSVRWTLNGAVLPFEAGDLVLSGSEESVTIADAPVIFAGHGVRLPERGIDQLAGADIAGAVVLILAQGPEVEGFPTLNERVKTVSAAGAVAVIVVAGADLPWQALRRGGGRRTTQLESAPAPRLSGLIPMSAVQRLVAGAGGDMGRLLNDQPGSSFRAVTLPIRASMEASTAVNRYTSNNVVGRLRGSAQTGESLLFLAHWDHFGICRPEGAPDRICNGAVDNASGVAMMIEVAGRLSRQPHPPRDILFLATTSEEVGLLGAEYFAAHPTVPIESIVAAINMDTVAIHPAGEPVAVMGRGIPALDSVIDATIAAMGRRLDNDDEVAAFVRRQDGWKLTQAGVPAIMVGGSFSNMALLQAFLAGPYHQPEDQIGGAIVLEGAAEDANLTVELGRRLADPAQYQRPQRPAAAETGDEE